MRRCVKVQPPVSFEMSDPVQVADIPVPEEEEEVVRVSLQEGQQSPRRSRRKVEAPRRFLFE